MFFKTYQTQYIESLLSLKVKELVCALLKREDVCVISPSKSINSQRKKEQQM